ncbi:upstream activation factor subunit spp27-like [Humulus lupulus]|uniref:upstream activation factor subunit spp27-like n=1 Tax=Humulus lupulus TaxID=3486 RepID=UPI002B40EFBB|nr:upstream activation factor subunit spp27-like [Humulus lupulus]
MVSESELIERLQEFLRNSDLNTTTTAIVRRKLQEDFGVDLSDKKAFIREQVDSFLQSELEKAQRQEEVEVGHLDDDRSAEIKSEEGDGSDSMTEEPEDDEDEPVEQSRSTKVKRGSKKLPNDKKKRGGGFSKICGLSPQLQKFMGVSEMARTEVVKQMWTYIRDKNLQDPNDRRNIICDEPLRDLFGVDSINMFQMNKALSKHIWSLDSDNNVKPNQSEETEKKRKQEREESDEPKPKEKKQKGGNSGFLAPLQLSDALVNFLGTGESALSRSEVIKRMWNYIKQNNLQDPSDKRRIISDQKLKELFDVDSFIGFTVSKLLAAHLSKTD